MLVSEHVLTATLSTVILPHGHRPHHAGPGRAERARGRVRPHDPLLHPAGPAPRARDARPRRALRRRAPGSAASRSPDAARASPARGDSPPARRAVAGGARAAGGRGDAEAAI